MAAHVYRTVLSLAVRVICRGLNNLCARGIGLRVVRVDVRHPHHNRVVVARGTRRLPGPVTSLYCGLYGDDYTCVQCELRPMVADTEVLDETEGMVQPADGRV